LCRSEEEGHIKRFLLFPLKFAMRVGEKEACLCAPRLRAANLPVKNHKMLKVRFYQEEVTSERASPFLFSAPTCAESARPRTLPFSLFHSAGGAGLRRRRRKWKETRLYLPFIIPRQRELLCQFPCHSTRPSISPNYTLEKRLT
jgi:hypothetical protein